MQDWIEIKKARIHNLRNIDVRIPKNKMTVITGVSGSGKSSLAFDTLYEEGKKRYLTFSGAQFMIEGEDVFDSISGLSPTVAVEQRVIRQSNPRSTVGTRIKLDTMLAALMANFGVRSPQYDDGMPLEIAMFLKNSPKGMCVRCLGAGSIFHVDEEEIFKDKEVTIENLFHGNQTHYKHLYSRFEILYHINSRRRLSSLSQEELRLFQYGDGGGNSGSSGYLGVIPWLMENYRYHKAHGRDNWVTRLFCVGMKTCPKCGGSGMGEQSLHTTIADKTIRELEDMYICDLYAYLEEKLPSRNKLTDEILAKLRGLKEVGLGHIALSRPIPTLSGGELQRLFLASYLMAGMDSIIFVFDEPTIGLHELEKEKLIRLLRRIVERGNTVIAVEHDENFIRQADYIVDIGPGAGIGGGSRVYEGKLEDFLKVSASRTAPYLCGSSSFPVRKSYRKTEGKKELVLEHASLHNLKEVSVRIPLGVMVGVAGVSGSGKSSLISDTLVPKLKAALKTKCVMEEAEEEASEESTESAVLNGAENLKGCYIIDQRPIARSRTSCPATYTGIFDRVRECFAGTEQSVKMGYGAGMFSRNSEGGCTRCKGDGIVHNYIGYGNFIDLACEDCEGSGYLPEARAVLLDGKNICDVLQMSVEEALDFFAGKDEGIVRILSILQQVGMGYITLGQATPTISGGESQRIKLAKELAKGRGRGGKGYLYILDEPTTGLSLYDTQKLLELLDELVSQGNSVIVTEHDVHILSNCDYIIEMGRGGGRDGGEVIAAGNPKELYKNPNSMIGSYLTVQEDK